MTDAWLAVAAVGGATVAIKAAGPLLLGGRVLPERLQRVLAVLAPAVLAALVATLTFAEGTALTLDPRVAGVAASVVAIALRAPVLAVVIVAALTTALARLWLA